MPCNFVGYSLRGLDCRLAGDVDRIGPCGSGVCRSFSGCACVSAGGGVAESAGSEKSSGVSATMRLALVLLWMLLVVVLVLVLEPVFVMV